MKRALPSLLVAAACGLSGCVVAPDWAEQEARRERDSYVVVTEPGSRIPRYIRLSDAGSAAAAGASPVKTISGEAVRAKPTLTDVLDGL